MDVAIPLDSEGFLPQECPACNRPFRIAVTRDADEQHIHCPYCGLSFVTEDFLTSDQLDYLTGVAADAALRGLEEAGMRVERSGPRPPFPVPTGDFVRVEFTCHNESAIKALPAWLEAGQPLHCVVCGTIR